MHDNACTSWEIHTELFKNNKNTEWWLQILGQLVVAFLDWDAIHS